MTKRWTTCEINQNKKCNRQLRQIMLKLSIIITLFSFYVFYFWCIPTVLGYEQICSLKKFFLVCKRERLVCDTICLADSCFSLTLAATNSAPVWNGEQQATKMWNIRIFYLLWDHIYVHSNIMLEANCLLIVLQFWRNMSKYKYLPHPVYTCKSKVAIVVYLNKTKLK